MEKFKVIKLLAVKNGMSQQTGKPWKSREVVIESVLSAMHPNQFVGRLFGDAVDKISAQEGDVIGIELRHGVKEFNGSYYGETNIVDFEQVQPF